MTKSKKRLVLCCILLCMLFLFTGCKSIYKFTFDYTIDTTEYTRGSEVQLTAILTNDSGFTYSYYGASTDFRAHVYLYHESEDGIYVMPMKTYVTCDRARYRIENGASKIRVVHFTIPSDAPLGEYNLKLSFKKQWVEYENVLRVVE